MAGRAGGLSLRQAYTFSDFGYRHDARFGGNRLPGLPRHSYQAELRFDHASGLYAALNSEYASRIAVDYANSYWADSHVIFGSRIGYEAPVVAGGPGRRCATSATATTRPRSRRATTMPAGMSRARPRAKGVASMRACAGALTDGHRRRRV